MIEKETLTEIFGNFVGQEAAMEPGNMEVDVGGTKMKVANDVLTPKTFKLMSDVRAAAAENGLTARVIWPGTMVTMDFVETRIDLYLLQDLKGRLLLSLDSQTVPPRAPDHADIAVKGLTTALRQLKPPRFKPPVV